MTFISRIRAVVFVAASVLMAAGCEDPQDPPVRPAVSVTLNQTAQVLNVGQTVTLVATVANDSTGALSGVTWSSSAAGVAVVDASSGLVTAVAAGTATITATSKLDPTKSATAAITVNAIVDGLIGIAVVPITATQSPNRDIPAVVAVTGTTNKGFSVRSSNNAIASVFAQTETGFTISANTPGTAAITVLMAQDTTKRATVNVTVLPFPAAVSMPALGTGAVNERYTAEVAVGRGYAYTTTWGNRTQGGTGNVIKIWNIATGTPQLVDSLKVVTPQGTAETAITTSDVQISPDSTLMVVSTEFGNPRSGSILIYSLANPAKPTLVTRYQSANITIPGVHTVKMSVIGGKLYGFLQVNPGGGSGAKLVILDMSNPSAPVEVYSKVMGNPYIHDVLVRDGLLFTALWDDGMTIFDVGGGGRGGSPSNPVQIGNVDPIPGNIHNIAWFHDPRSGSKKYAFLGEEADAFAIGSFATGDIHVVDVSDLTAPRQVARFAVNGAGAHNFYIDEPSGILYAAYYNGGVRAIDIRGDLGTCTAAQKVPASDPFTPGVCDLRLMGREAGIGLTTTNYIWGVQMQGNRLYASDMQKGLIIFDATALKR